MEFFINPSPADIMAALLLLTLGIMLFLLLRWTDDGSRSLLLNRMIARAGGRPDAATDPSLGEELASAARTCAGCRSRKECEAMLAEHLTSEIPEYCPNRRLIQALAAKPG